MSDLYAHEFTWSGNAGHVIATGSFDGWKETLALTRNAEGKLTATLPIKYGEKITFKYIVDGHWQHNPEEPHESDGSGNVNNVFTAPEAPVVIPIGEPAQPVLPVPESIATTDAAVISPAVISEPTPITPVEEEKKEEQETSFLGAAAAGVGAAVIGAAGLVGAAVTSVAGSSPLTLVSSQDEKVKEPTHTPAVVTTTNALASPPPPAALEKAIVEEKKKEETPSRTNPGAPILGAAAAGVAAIGTGAAVVANKTSETASSTATSVQKSSTFQTAEAKAHDLAVQADKYKDQAVAEANKAYAEGERLAGEAYDKVAATSFGASAMKALGLNHKEAPHADATTPVPVSVPAPVVTPGAIAPIIPINEAAPSPAPSAPLPAAPSSAPAVTSSPVVANQPTIPAAAVAPVIPVAEASSAAPVSSTPIAQQFASPSSSSSSPALAPAPVPAAASAPAPTPAAPATPAKETIKKKFEGLGNGEAPSQSSPSASTKKKNLFKRIFSSKDK